MPEDVAVMDAPVVDAVDTQVDATENVEIDKPEQTEEDKQDNRKQPDALRKRIAELRRQADAITDPVQKQALLKDAKALNDLVGKARAYEQEFPTVREVREIKALLDAVGGREGFHQMQATLSEVEQVDKMLSAGDAEAAKRLWDEAPDGMPKLVAPIADRFEQEKPQEYAKFIAPRAVRFMDQAGFPQAFDALTKAYEANDFETAKAIKAELINWVIGNRKGQEQAKQSDPEVERLRQQLEEKNKGEESRQVETAYNAVIDHAGPTIDKFLKPMVSKLGLSTEQYQALRNNVWDHLQTTRNADGTYKTVAPAKQKQGYSNWTEYAKRWTQDHAEESARHVVKLYYGHQLKNGATTQTATQAVRQPGVTMGKEPSPGEIDYSVKGVEAAKKAGFKDLQDMLLAGQAPLKAGGIRKWR